MRESVIHRRLISRKACRGLTERLKVKEEPTKMKYDMRKIMLRAWTNYRKNQNKGLSFGECLHRAWITAKAEGINAERIEAAKTAAGVQEETNTWSGWKSMGYEVIHGSKALFGAELIWGSRGDGAVYKARFFGRSQVEELPVA